MAHMVENMMYVGETPWHGLGKRIPIEVPSNLAIEYAGLDWKVQKLPVFLADPLDSRTCGKEATEYRAIVRATDRSILSVQSKTYEPFQNSEMFEFAESLVGTKRALFHTAGSLDGGRRVWALMKTEGAIELLKGDTVEKYLLLASSHDGSLAFLSAFTGVRVVCQNTLNAALSNLKDRVSIRHTGNLKDRVEQAQRIMGLSSKYFDKFGELANTLIKTPYTDPQVMSLTATIFPGKVTKDDKVEVSTRTQNNRDTVTRLFTTGKGHGPFRGTAWAAYNAVAEYTDHNVSGRRTVRMSPQENRLNSIWFTSGAALKQKALGHIMEQTGLKQAA